MDAEGSAPEKRSRKATTFFKAPEAVVKKEISTAGGRGITLGENPHFCKDLDAIKSDNEVCKALHSVMFNSVGKKTDMKKNLRAFCGFLPDENIEEKKLKVLEKKKIWTVSLLKTALGMFGIEKSGDRDALVGRMIDYLAEPRFTKDAGSTKRKSMGKSATKKGAKKSKKSKNGVKKAPSGYILYCKDQRATLRAEQPDLSMIDQTRALGALWNALDDGIKESWNEKARQLKAELAGEEGGVGSDDDKGEEAKEGVELTGEIDFGSDDEEEEDGEQEDGNNDDAEDDFKDLED